MKLLIGFSTYKSYSILSKLIMLFENSKFSHAYLRWTTRSLELDMVYQASRGMVHFVSGERFDDTNTTVELFEIDLTEAQFDKVVKRCVELAGVNYGFWQLVGMALARVLKTKNLLKDGPKTFVCSELVGEILKQIYPKDLNLDLELLGPKALAEKLKQLPKFKRVTPSN